MWVPRDRDDPENDCLHRCTRTGVEADGSVRNPIIAQNGEGRVTKLLEFSNNEAIKRAVAGGDGIALMSEKVADEEIRTGKLIAIPLTDPPVTRTFYLIQRKDKFISRPLANLLEIIEHWTDKTRCDSLTGNHAVEFDFGNQLNAAIDMRLCLWFNYSTNKFIQ